MLEQPGSEGLDLVKRAPTGAVCEERQPVGMTHVGEVHEEL